MAKRKGTYKKKIKCVISYSHRDENSCSRFKEHLEAISRTNPLEIWLDKRIKTGQSIDSEVKKHFNDCDIVFILLSVYYIRSNYCYEKELKMAYERHNSSKCIIVPVILSAVATIDQLPFHNINRIPKDGKPIRTYKPYENGYNAADKMIVDLLKDFKIDNTNAQIDLGNFAEPDHDKSKELKPTDKKKTNNTYNTKQKNLKSLKSNNIPTYKIVKEGKIVDEEITQNIILAMPNYFESTNKFNVFADTVVNNSIENYKKAFNKSNYKTIQGFDRFRFKQFRGFLYDLSNCIQKLYIADVNVRVHFRRLYVDHYEGIVVSGNENNIENAKKLTPMPSQEGMIFISGLLSMPLLRSFNKSLHKSGNNDNIWIEHLTCTFKNVVNAKTPIISMGISLNKHLVNDFTPILILMAYTRLDIRIDELINQYIDGCKNIDKDYEISQFINSKI